jgi:hypothetical protein
MESQSYLFLLLNIEGYYDLKRLAGRGICGIRSAIFTSDLCYGCDIEGFQGRYCFQTPGEARKSLKEWNGQGDPPGNWIKHKGGSEYLNPNYDRATAS